MHPADSYTQDMAQVARGNNPTPLQARTHWTVTHLPGQQAPPMRSTKCHGKSGHYKPNTKYRYFRQLQHSNPITG